uniref:Anaphase-promoting complex subunit 4-like WD40 domain-containing protein n=1 Tax=Setaria digitata TaxID=48799 RepID=A0A915PYL5_9BILA
MAKLERVLGCTVISRSSVSVDDNRGIVAYPAGATVILYNPRNNAQAHLIGTTKNSITCLSFSLCGRYIATGETGHEPRIRVWELYDPKGQFAFTQIVDIKHHQLGINCVRFTPNGYLVSVGNQHDRSIVVWEWRTQQKIAENRLTSKVNSIDITEQGGCVTVGIRHVKFWHVAKRPEYSKSVPLQGRSAILADQRNNTFLDVCCAPDNRTFSVTETSLLIEFHDKKLVSTYDLHNEVPRSLVLGIGELFVGFNNGFIRCFDIATMKHKFTFCKPHYLSCDVAEGAKQDALSPGSHPTGCRYPDVRTLTYNKRTGMLTVIYSDRSIYTWQQTNQSILKISSQLFHVGPIYPPNFEWLPQGSFITGGTDQTIRMWNVDHLLRSFDENKATSLPYMNVFSDDLKKVIFLTNKVFGAPLSDTCNGVKSLKVSPDGKHLAAGSRDGNLSIYDLTISTMEMIAFFEAHESDIMCMEYSDPQSTRYLLATGSRDRMVHLFDPLNSYQPLASIDDHTSTVNSILFVQEGDNLQLISSAADRSIVIRKMVGSEPSSVTFSRVTHIKSQFGLNCVVLNTEGMVAACQDRQLRTYSFQGKLTKQIKGAASDDGQLTRVRLDPSGIYAATVCTNRNVYIIDVATGEFAAVLTGQSENITDIAFSADCRRLYVISYSGCIFVWRLSNFLVNKMLAVLRKSQFVKNIGTPGIEKISERSETPDSLLGSGSDAAADEHLEYIRNAKVKDSESEFGSLNSIKIGDEDSDSCMGQKPPTVFINTPLSSVIADDDFELKRVTTEVVRRSMSGVMNEQHSNWDSASAANDFSDDEQTPPSTAATVAGGSSGATNFGQKRLGSNLTAVGGAEDACTISNTLSNLQFASQLGTNISMVHSNGVGNGADSIKEGNANIYGGTVIGGSNALVRKPRKKWDDVTVSPIADTPSYAASLISNSLDVSSTETHDFPLSTQPSSSKDNVLGGFMTMNGTQIQYSPRLSQRNVHKRIPNSISSPGIAELQQRVSSFSLNNTVRNAVESPELHNDTLVKVSPSMFPQSPSSAFSRATVKRCSLTKRLKGIRNNEPQTVWTPPLIGTRRSASNMHYTTVSGRTIPVARRKSDLHITLSRLYQQQQEKNNLSATTIGRALSPLARCRAISDAIRNRRMTIAGGFGSLSSQVQPPAREEDYISSDLHLRSRSQSPSQLALNALGSEKRQRQDSDMSTYSVLTMASTRLTPSSSRTNLRSVALNKQQSSQTLNRLAGLRDRYQSLQSFYRFVFPVFLFILMTGYRLRKSQENLAGTLSDDGFAAVYPNIMSRSKSFGNLRLTAAAPLGGSRSGLSSLHGSNADAAGLYLSRLNSDTTPVGTSGLNIRNRLIARSVGNLYTTPDSNDSFVTNGLLSQAEISVGTKGERNLAKAIENLKKASNPDLSHFEVSETDQVLLGTENEPEHLFPLALSIRNQKGKGAVQKRVERYQPRNRISRDTTSGESDSNSSEVNGSPQLQSGGTLGQQFAPRRYFSTVNGSNRSISCVENMPRQSVLQTRRIFEPQQRHNSSNTQRRVPSYLAQKLASGDIVAPDLGGDEYPRQSTPSSEAVAFHDFAAKTHQSKRKFDYSFYPKILFSSCAP